MEESECPSCGGRLKVNNIVILKGNNVKTVGYEHFCTDMNCNYEKKIK